MYYIDKHVIRLGGQCVLNQKMSNMPGLSMCIKSKTSNTPGLSMCIKEKHLIRQGCQCVLKKAFNTPGLSMCIKEKHLIHVLLTQTRAVSTWLEIL